MPLAIAFIDDEGKISIGSTTDGKNWTKITNGRAGVEQTPYSSTVTPGLARGPGKAPHPDFALSYTSKHGNVDVAPWGNVEILTPWPAGKSIEGATPALLTLAGFAGYPPLLVAFPSPPPLGSPLPGTSQTVVGSTAWPPDLFEPFPSLEQRTMRSASLANFPVSEGGIDTGGLYGDFFIWMAFAQAPIDFPKWGPPFSCEVCVCAFVPGGINGDGIAIWSEPFAIGRKTSFSPSLATYLLPTNEGKVPVLCVAYVGADSSELFLSASTDGVQWSPPNSLQLESPGAPSLTTGGLSDGVTIAYLTGSGEIAVSASSNPLDPWSGKQILTGLRSSVPPTILGY